MITVPLDVKCNFCTKTFCCLKCRVNHEKTTHQDEINQKIREEYLRSICHICCGVDLPIKINQMLSSELLQHISEDHLPLKCNKCEKIFDNINDFQLIGKCCSVKPSEEMTNENMGENVVAEKRKIDINGNEEALTPLSKINLRWRRKSREFKSIDSSHIKNEESVQGMQPVKRQTSTPMQGIFDSLSPMQFSSINSVSSSSESEFSPLPLVVPIQKPPAVIVVSPKSNKKIKAASPQSKGRKMIVHNTPLRQVMTKSIQRAMATHGHYKHVLQQRKMTFDSSSSSNEPTMSLMKLHVETEAIDNNNDQPLDLRLSPALRRNNEEKIPEVVENENFQYEEIHVVLRRSESETSSLTSYKSCYSDNGTPKGSSSSILKKTISFEAPGNVDKTPAFLMPKKSFTMDQDDDDNEEDDIFYTPRSTPLRRVKSLDMTETKSIKKSQGTLNSGRNNIWSYVTSMMGSLVAKSDGSESTENNKAKWGFHLENPLKVAANYFGNKHSEKNLESIHNKSLSDGEESINYSCQKRPRAIFTSPIEEAENTKNVVNSPIPKRRKIQGRKPIERMRKLA